MRWRQRQRKGDREIQAGSRARPKPKPKPRPNGDQLPKIQIPDRHLAEVGVHFRLGGFTDCTDCRHLRMHGGIIVIVCSCIRVRR